MTPRLQGQNCKFSPTLFSRNSQKRFEHKEYQTKCRKMTRKPRSHDRILIYRTWAIPMSRWSDFLCACNTMTNKREKRYLNIKCEENLRFLLERAGLSSFHKHARFGPHNQKTGTGIICCLQRTENRSCSVVLRVVFLA